MDSVLDDILLGDEDEQKSPSTILKELTLAWINEKNAPELLQVSSFSRSTPFARINFPVLARSCG